MCQRIGSRFVSLSALATLLIHTTDAAAARRLATAEQVCINGTAVWTSVGGEVLLNGRTFHIKGAQPSSMLKSVHYSIWRASPCLARCRFSFFICWSVTDALLVNLDCTANNAAGTHWFGLETEVFTLHGLWPGATTLAA